MNLFDIPEQLPEQELTEILLTGKTRIERIVSNGHTSGWYDQTEDEWVCVLQGIGELTYADGSKQRLHAGDTAYLVLIYILRSRGGFGAQGFAINDNAALVNGFQLI